MSVKEINISKDAELEPAILLKNNLSTSNFQGFSLFFGTLILKKEHRLMADSKCIKSTWRKFGRILRETLKTMEWYEVVNVIKKV